ncbi:MAG: ABC transporter substrate-binding protein [Syntrophomonas sp.]|nr:ABC transporter substrate-binding protein [Syntrophomonas sp.]
MKKSFKSVVILVCLSLLMTSLVGCTPNQKEAGESQNSDKKLQIGIVQIVEHPSLNTIRESFVQELDKQGFKDGEKVVIDYQNAQGDQTNLKTICQKFVNNKYDLIIAIATPSAQAAVGETKDIPIVFSACTDPVGSGLVSNLEKPGQNVTGTSDAVSAQKIMELAQRITPDIKTVGALYTSSETNSVSVVNDLKDYAAKNGLTVIEATVTNSSEVQQAVSSLVGKVDAVFSPIDNTVASAMPLVAQVANKAKKPVYVGADSMVKDGGLATFGINYTILGQETAQMAVEILNGKKAGEISVKTMTDMDIYVNKDTAAAIGITIPDDVLKAATVFQN